MKKTKKGFTLVELVIVIAIIAILAAVLIPTFSRTINRAQESADTQLIRNLNTAVALELASSQKSKYDTPYEAVEACRINGYDIKVIVAKSSYNIAYDLKEGHFVLLDEKTDTIIFPVSEKQTTQFSATDKTNFFVFKTSMPKNYEYSVYAGYKWSQTEVTLNGIGFDAGVAEGIKKISYENETGTPRNVLIRSNSFETMIVVDAPTDTVRHFDYAASVDVIHIAPASYHENGTVGRVELHDVNGHIEAEDECEIFCLMNATGVEQTAGNKPIVQVNEGAIVHTNDQNKNVASSEIGKEQTNVSTKGVANGHFDDCGAGRHSFSQLVVDSEHVYDVCTCCGYTLVKVMDEAGTEIKQTKNTLVKVTEGEGETAVTRWVVAEDGETVTPTKTYLTTSEIPTTTNEKGEKVADVTKIDEITTNGQITTDGNDGEPIEEEPVVVSKDEEGKPIVIERTCKHEFRYTDVHFTKWPEEDVCLGTCIHCGLQIKTQHDWVVVTHPKDQTEYEGRCTKCNDCVRETFVAKIEGIGSFKTLPDAFDAIHNGETKTATIKLIDNEKFDIVDKALRVEKGENITLDLNGYVLSGYCSKDATSAMIYNDGTLVLCDSTDTNKDGSGLGKMVCGATAAWEWSGVIGDYAGSFASNMITNYGELTIESGSYDYVGLSSGDGGKATYNIDTYSSGNVTVSGGKLTNSSASAIRTFGSTGTVLITGKTSIYSENA